MLKHRHFNKSWSDQQTSSIGKDISNISLGALGLKKYTSSRKKYFAFGWRFVFSAIFFFYLITGISPLDILNKSLFALNGQNEKIRLYANSCTVDVEASDYKTGWWNTDKATRQPDLGPTADTLDFNDDKAAFYSGGQGSIVCSSFSLLTLADLEKASSSRNQIIASTSDIIASENEVPFAETDTVTRTIPENEASLTDFETADSLTSAETNDIQPAEIIDTDSATVDITVDQAAPENKQTDDGDKQVEIIDQTNTEADQKIEIIPEENIAPMTDADGVETSFLHRIKNYFGSLVARAEEYISTNIIELKDLGEFKKATINFSLALSASSVNIETVPADINVETEDTGEVMASSSISISEEEINTEDTAVDSQIEINQSETESDDETSVAPLQTEETEVIIDESAQDKDVDILPLDQGEESPVSLYNQFLEIAKPQTVKAYEDFQNSAKLIIWYATEETLASTSATTTQIVTLWQQLDVITGETMSNALNGQYFSYDAPYLENWDSIKNLKIKVEGVVDEQTVFAAYLDSVWVEAEFDPETELEKLKKRQRWEEALDFLSKQVDFQVGEDGEMKFRYNKNEERIWDTLGEMIGLGNFWSDVSLEAKLVDSSGQTLDIPLSIIFDENGEFTIALPDDIRNLKPGEYKVVFHIEDKSGDVPEIFDLSQQFSWGIMALNFNKSIYEADETAYLQMAILDSVGHAVCDAEVFVSVTDPDGDVFEFSTADIYRNPACGPESVTDMPDYYAYYNFNDPGDYNFVFKAITESGEREISETISVVGRVDFVTERAGPTRIYPKVNYDMSISVRPDQDFRGDIVETVPLGFKITDYKLRITNSDERDPYGENFAYDFDENGDAAKIVWQDIEISAGDELVINYTFDAPDVSPEFYLLGPLEMSIDNRKLAIENRQWQIASDAVLNRARTVKFIAGVYNGGATSGNSTNADYTFSQFNFRLAETGVDIKNAYVLFEAQVGAYADDAGNFTGYKLGFDACVESCTAAAFGTGAGQVLNDNSRVLVYDESESNQVRLIYDVTNESQIAAYTGGNVLLEGQVGYRIKHAATVSSIAHAKAVLVVTYTYDPQSVNLTNTVVYPLDSTYGSDRGSRTLSQGACTLNSTCPKYDYTMDIPEWPGTATTTNRLAQWFRLYDANDGNNAVDINPNLNIEYGGQTSNQASASFHFEAANGGTQGNMSAMFFDAWANSQYRENAAQQLEVYFDSGTNYAVGGEVFETYIASSSAPVKTRTVTMPLGILSNGNNTSLNFKNINVYFPENGSTSGTVTVKSAYFRIIPHHYNNGAWNLQVSSKVGTNATTSNLQYDYNGGGTVVKSAYNIIHIIPTADYAALEDANESSMVPVRLNITPSDVSFDGISAELVITYTYSNEASGYLTNINLFGGQSSSNPVTSTTTATAASVLPETTGKTMLAGGLHASYISSESDGIVNTGNVFLYDANLSTGNPTCSNAFRAEPDDQNNFVELYKDVTSAMNTTDGQAYNACFSADETLVATDGASMNAELIYTYAWENSPPNANYIIASTTQKRNGSGVVDIAVSISDVDKQDTRAMIKFATGTSCVFTSAGDPTLDETNGNITAKYGDPNIENDNTYQLGTADAYVTTASGTNSVEFDWLSKSDLGSYEGYYCLQTTANDTFMDDPTPTTTTVYVDNKLPSQPGALNLYSRTGGTLTLAFGATSTETNFNEYIIYYKVYDGTDPDEGDSFWASTSDINLNNKLFNGAATTTIDGLSALTTYSLAIWAYDNYGNKSSSSRVDIITNDAPVSSFQYAQQRNNGTGVVDMTIQVDDLNNQDDLMAKLEYATGTACLFANPGDPTLDENTDNILASFGFPRIDNQSVYQIGSSSGRIITSPGANNIEFDWLGKLDMPNANGEYCLRLTVNDQYENQRATTTTIVTLDNVKPTAPGVLSYGRVTTDSIVLRYATTTPATDTNEPTTNAYKIYYKQGIAGVTPGLNGETEIDNTNLNAYDYNEATSTTVTGLDSNTWYVFNIWSYDAYGNMATATEIAIKTNAPISNDSLTFMNPQSDGLDTNIAVAGPGLVYTFRAVVSEINGWYAIASTTLRIANGNDSVSPYTDLAFRWNQSTNQFSEVGDDAGNMASLAGSSSADCSGNTCTLNFNIIFNKTFANSSQDYVAEIYSGNDSGVVDYDSYANFYQVRFPYIEQIHYRWRNDDGGE